MRLDDTAVQVANRTTEAGAVTGIVGWLASVNWIGWFGVMIALGGFAANIYFQRKRDKREQAESEARLAALRERCGL